MKRFQWFRLKKQRSRPQIGISQNAEMRCFVWQIDNKINHFWQQTHEPLENGIIQAVTNLQNFVIIRPLPNDYIWRKTVFLPLIPNESLIYKQVIAIFRQELPIALEQVYFDFVVEHQTEQKLTKINLFAIKKAFANQQMTKYPTILDCENHCYLRAAHYLQPESDIENPQVDLDKFNFNNDILDKTLYLCALGASLWNGKELI